MTHRKKYIWCVIFPTIHHKNYKKIRVVQHSEKIQNVRLTHNSSCTSSIITHTVLCYTGWNWIRAFQPKDDELKHRLDLWYFFRSLSTIAFISFDTTGLPGICFWHLIQSFWPRCIFFFNAFWADFTNSSVAIIVAPAPNFSQVLFIISALRLVHLLT